LVVDEPVDALGSISEPVLRFMNRLIEKGATDEQIRRMSEELNRKFAEPERLESEERY
jgi:hypothetical protein